MKNSFFKQILASAIGTGVIFFIAFFFVLILIGGAIGSAFDTEKVATSVDSNSILHVKLDNPIVDRGNENDINFDFATLQPDTRIGLNHIIEDIDKASKDSRIEGMFLDLSGVSGMPSTIDEVYSAIKDFGDSGKWIVAFGETYSMGAYTIASAADEVYLYPQGGIDFHGLTSELMFFKNMLDDLGVDVEVLRGPDNKYKSAVEPFLRSDMSDENRYQSEELLGDIWFDMANKIANNRGITYDKVNALANNLSIRVPEDALQNGLVDDLKYRDEVMQILMEKTGRTSENLGSDDEENESQDTLDEMFVSLSDYHSAKLPAGEDGESKGSWKKDRVAVVYAVGAIESGEGDDETIGSVRIAGALREARLDDKIKAVVLRVNSPGGSALASDVIWRETQLIKESGKPFVVSMGDLAASGGYYISAGADKIFANENTITGSIGVFGMIPSTERMLDEKLGITIDRVSTHDHAGVFTGIRGLDDLEKQQINYAIADIYDDFITLVAEGRGMSKADVDSIAQGRVWTGQDALSKGLVDEIGSLEDAVAFAASEAGIEEYRTKDYPKVVDPFEELMKEFGAQAQMEGMMAEIGIGSKYVDQIKQLQKMVTSGETIQARMPFYITIE